MPISNERVPNKPLSGPELVQIIEKDVHDILSRDGMFNINIAFRRVSYEVRVTMHLDNPIYPEHVSTTLSRPAGKNVVEVKPELGALEPHPLADNERGKPELSEDETIFSQERHREIASPNMARVEHGIPLKIDKRNMDTGVMETKEQKFIGDIPDPLSVGNLTRDLDTASSERVKLNRPVKGGRH